LAGFVHEFKLGGYRVQAHLRDGRVTLDWRCLGAQQTTNGIVAPSRDKTQP